MIQGLGIQEETEIQRYWDTMLQSDTRIQRYNVYKDTKGYRNREIERNTGIPIYRGILEFSDIES